MQPQPGLSSSLKERFLPFREGPGKGPTPPEAAKAGAAGRSGRSRTHREGGVPAHRPDTLSIQQAKISPSLNKLVCGRIKTSEQIILLKSTARCLLDSGYQSILLAP